MIQVLLESDVLIWTGIAFCLSQSALFSGLNLAIFSVSRLRLEVRAASGDRDAARVLALRKRFGTGVGGFAAPAFFGALIETGSRGAVFAGYACGAAVMCAAAVVAAFLGVDAERKSLEDVAKPLSAE